MASDVRLLILDPTKGVVVIERWLGMRKTVERIREVLRRSPDHTRAGWESWGRVSTDEARNIVGDYANGASSDEIDAIGTQFPAALYWWTLHHDF